MDLAYTLVKLGRSARNAANIKNRQPLSEILISTNSLPKYYGDIITDELNIKEVETSIFESGCLFLILAPFLALLPSLTIV